jgi:hypothetical protein
MPRLAHEDNVRIDDYSLRDIETDARKEVEDHFKQDQYFHMTLTKYRSQYETYFAMGFAPDERWEEAVLEKCEGLANILRLQNRGKVRAWLRTILPESERGELNLLAYIQTTVRMIANNH